MIRFSFSVKKEKPTVWQMKDERPGEVHQSLRFRLSLFYVLPVAAIVIKSVSRMGRDLSLPLSHPPPLSRIVFLPLLSLSLSLFLFRLSLFLLLRYSLPSWRICSRLSWRSRVYSYNSFRKYRGAFCILCVGCDNRKVEIVKQQNRLNKLSVIFRRNVMELLRYVFTDLNDFLYNINFIL